jgi:hypothetical protein
MDTRIMDTRVSIEQIHNIEFDLPDTFIIEYDFDVKEVWDQYIEDKLYDEKNTNLKPFDDLDEEVQSELISHLRNIELDEEYIYTVGEYWQDFQDNTDGDYYNDPPEVTYGQLDFFVKTANEKGWDINLSNTELEIKERHDKVVKLINNIESNFNRFISKKTSDMKNISSNNGTYQIN